MFGIHLLDSLLPKPVLYLDPGSGSFILQVLLASILGAGFAIKVYWKKIIGFFKKGKPEQNADEESDAEIK
jgi:hypothetical protein